MPVLTDDEITYLRAHFNYNPETGDIINVATGIPVVPMDRHYNRTGMIWRVNAGPRGKGRLVRLLHHRGAFILHTGRNPDPDVEIDHINGDPTDNRWRNLRAVSPSTNCRNHPRRQALRRRKNGWQAATIVRGQMIVGPVRRYKRWAQIERAMLGLFFAHDLSRNYDPQDFDAACRLYGFDPDLIRLLEDDEVLWGARWNTTEPPPPYLLVGEDGWSRAPFDPAAWPAITATTEAEIVDLLHHVFRDGLDDRDRAVVREIVADSVPADPDRKRSRPMCFTGTSMTTSGAWFTALAAAAPATHAAVKARVMADA